MGLVRRRDGDLPGVEVRGAVPAPARVEDRPERLLLLLLLVVVRLRLDRPALRPRRPLPLFPPGEHAPHGARVRASNPTQSRSAPPSSDRRVEAGQVELGLEDGVRSGQGSGAGLVGWRAGNGMGRRGEEGDGWRKEGGAFGSSPRPRRRRPSAGRRRVAFAAFDLFPHSLPQSYSAILFPPAAFPPQLVLTHFSLASFLFTLPSLLGNRSSVCCQFC